MSIELKNVTYTYSPGTAYESHALKDVSLVIPDGQFIGIIGHTGSGKSTLIQHLNALVQPTSGQVLYNGEDVWAEKYDRKQLRSEVGLVFQYPEHQLFENDVISDVCFGPMNQGLSREEAEKEAKQALTQVGVKDDILDQIAELHKVRGITIVLVSHSMEDIAKYVERLIVMNHGEAVFDDEPKKVFSHYKELETMGLAAPQITYIMHALKEHGLHVDADATTVEEARDSILAVLAQANSPLLNKGGAEK